MQIKNKLATQNDKTDNKERTEFFVDYSTFIKKEFNDIFISLNIFYQNNMLHIQKE